MNPPMREPTFLILTALAREPMHGYGIINEVAALSDGRLSLRPGTLYGALDRLTDEGLVEPDREEVVDGRLRRYYRLTDAGGTSLATETERLRHNVEAATQRLRARFGSATLGDAPNRAPNRTRPATRLAAYPATRFAGLRTRFVARPTGSPA